MFSLQYYFGFIFFLVSCFYLGQSIVLHEKDIQNLCTETRSGDYSSVEAVDHLWKNFKGHFSRSAGKSQDETIDEMLIKSLVDDFSRGGGKHQNNHYYYYDDDDDDDDRSIIAKYKIKQKKYASTDVTDVIAIQNATVTSSSAITMRQTHDKVKNSKVDKKILFFNPSVSMGRSRRAANDDASLESDDEYESDDDMAESCQSLTLSEPMDSSKPMEWWAGVHNLRQQLGLIQ